VSDRNVLPYQTRSAAKAAGKPAAKPAAVLAVPAAEPAVADDKLDTDDELDDPNFVPPIESGSETEGEELDDEDEELDDQAALLSARLERFDSPVSFKNVISGPRPARAAAVAARAAIEAEVARAVDVNKDEANDDDWVPCADGEEAEDDEEELIEAPRVALAVVATPPVAVVLAAAPSAVAAPALAPAPAPARTVLLPEDCTRRAALYCSTSKLRAPRSATLQALVEQPAGAGEEQAAVIVVEQRQAEAAPGPTVVSQAASSAPRRATPSFDLTESSERCGDYCALL
jgi:hypothetical protein